MEYGTSGHQIKQGEVTELIADISVVFNTDLLPDGSFAIAPDAKRSVQVSFMSPTEDEGEITGSVVRFYRDKDELVISVPNPNSDSSSKEYTIPGYTSVKSWLVKSVD